MRLHGLTKIKLGKGTKLVVEEPVRIYETSYIRCKQVSIGAFTYIVQARIRVSTHIGRFCSIARGAVIGSPNHPVDWLSTSSFQYLMNDKFGWHPLSQDFVVEGIPKSKEGEIFGRQVTIGNDVWIGQNVQIMRGVNIGTGSIVAAGAVVVKDVPPYAIYGGVPAKLIRYRFDEETIQRLLKSEWWKINIKYLSGLNFSNVQATLEAIEAIIEQNPEDLYKEDHFEPVEVPKA